jgi:hypothetical protein
VAGREGHHVIALNLKEQVGAHQERACAALGETEKRLSGKSIVAYQDMRAAFRHGGTAAIIPPVSEKLVPTWLQDIWNEAEASLRRSDVWVVCGYSMPAYDTKVLELLRRGGTGRSLAVFLMSPESDALRRRWTDLLPQASITCLPGLPDGIGPLADHLASLQ